MDDFPAGAERRMVLRLLHVWRESCGAGRFPTFDSLAADQLGEFRPHAFILDLGEPADDPVFREIGQEIAAHSPIELVGHGVSEVPKGSLIAESVRPVAEVLRRQVPVSLGGRISGEGGNDILYRSIVLPLSADGERMTALLGAANCRVAG